MTFKNTLKSRQAQSTVEYIVIMIMVAIAVLIMFGAFNPDRADMRNTFDRAINSAIGRLR